MLIEIVKRLYPKAEQTTTEKFAQSAEVLAEFGISATRNRLHFFVAQLGHESGGLTVREENLNYSVRRLRQVWPSRFPSDAKAAPFAHNPEALANEVYGGRMGNDQPGDGFKYRGRGYIQLTGKDGYREVGRRAGLDLVAFPALAADVAHCVRIACAFWEWKGLNRLCDRGDLEADFEAVTRGINGGTNGLEDRFKWLRKAQDIVPWPLPSERPDEVTGIVVFTQGDPARWLYVGGKRRLIRSPDEITELRAEKLLGASEVSLSSSALEAIPIMAGSARP